MKAESKGWTFTLEAGRGETYASGMPTMYGHGRYPRGSVMAGRDRRVFIESWDSWEEARAAVKAIRKVVKGFRCEDWGDAGGSSHVPVAVATAGIPDTDY